MSRRGRQRPPTAGWFDVWEITRIIYGILLPQLGWIVLAVAIAAFSLLLFFIWLPGGLLAFAVEIGLVTWLVRRYADQDDDA